MAQEAGSTMMAQLEWERYFFRRLATTFFRCRWAVMGHQVEGERPIGSRGDLEGYLQGMQDYGWAMRDAIARRRRGMEPNE